MKHISYLASSIVLATCSSPSLGLPQETFFLDLSKLCGKAFAGNLVSDDEVDADFANQPMVMHVRTCSEHEIRIPFSVGDDRSRTWVITRQENGLRLKHDHRHEDGSADALTQYGGDTLNAGSPTRQSFPVDAFSIAMFEREGLTASMVNVWAVEVQEGVFVYELTRPGRLFRIEFDTHNPVGLPPSPWSES